MKESVKYKGIYGFDFTKTMEFDWGRLIPVYAAPAEAQKQARSQSSYKLTGIVECSDLSPQEAVDLAAVLTFIEQMEVGVLYVADECSFDLFPASLDLLPLHSSVRSYSPGALLFRDSLSGSSRYELIKIAMEKLSREHPKTSALRSCFFKHVLSLKQMNPVLDVDYFLNFSGLESLARDRENLVDSSNIAAKAISQYLQKFGFKVVRDQPANQERSMQVYAHLRNANFHNGKYEAAVSVKNDEVTYSLTEGALFRLKALVSLTLLKEFGFDDGHINWNGWLDHQPFC